MSSGTLMSFVVGMVGSLEAMAKNQSIDKEECLTQMHDNLCHVIQMMISEPHRTSFAVPQPVDLAVDDFIVQYTERQITEKLDECYNAESLARNGGR